METPVTFTCSGQQLVGILHMPDRRKGHVPAVVFFHGFTGTKVEPHQIFVKMARALAQAGMAALRFDFRGSGDSEGDFSRMTITGELKDARAALAFIRKQPGVDRSRVGLIGLSTGGLIAGMMLGEDPRLVAAALWSPVVDLVWQAEQRMTPEARRQLKTMGLVDDHGNAVGRMFLADAPRHDPLKAIAKTRAAVLLIHGSDDQTVPVSASSRYERALKKTGRAVVKHIVRGADHTYNSLAWETQVVGLTLEWFRCYFG